MSYAYVLIIIYQLQHLILSYMEGLLDYLAIQRKWAIVIQTIYWAWLRTRLRNSSKYIKGKWMKVFLTIFSLSPFVIFLGIKVCMQKLYALGNVHSADVKVFTTVILKFLLVRLGCRWHLLRVVSDVDLGFFV